MVTGRFAPKPVPPGTIRSKTIFRTGRFTPGRFAPFVKIEIKVFLRMKIVFDELWTSFSWRTISRDIFVLFLRDKMVCLFVFQKSMGQCTQGTVRTNLKKMKVNASNDRF